MSQKSWKIFSSLKMLFASKNNMVYRYKSGHNQCGNYLKHKFFNVLFIHYNGDSWGFIFS